MNAEKIIATAPEQFEKTPRSCRRELNADDALVLLCSDSDCWVFPWTQFVSAHFSSDEQSETMQIGFSSHQAMLRGYNLKLLVDMLARRNVSLIEAVDLRYARLAPEDEPFVNAITVKATDGAE